MTILFIIISQYLIMVNFHISYKMSPKKAVKL